METLEYTKLDQLDGQHWFYRGKRKTVQHWIRQYLDLQADDLLIDAGCGTGTFLVEMSGECRVLGIDDYDESITLARPRVEAVGGEVLRSPLDDIPLPNGSATVVTALDVLEHLDDDQAAVQELTRLLRPGGLLVVTVPALRALWSDWDVSLHHRRRYHRDELRQRLDLPELELLRCSYFNSVALLPIMMVRTWRKLQPLRDGAPRAEDQLPSRWVNELLYQSMVQPACWDWFHPPVGVSLLAIARKRA